MISCSIGGAVGVGVGVGWLAVSTGVGAGVGCVYICGTGVEGWAAA
jgi:hypothetical protein